MICKLCPARGNFNGCMCYFGKEPNECNLTNEKVMKMIKEYEERQTNYYASYNGDE